MVPGHIELGTFQIRTRAILAAQMATVSAVIFLYGPNTKLAAISALNMDDAGNTASAAAMGMAIVLTSAVAKGVQIVITRGLERKTQAWRLR